MIRFTLSDTQYNSLGLRQMRKLVGCSVMWEGIDKTSWVWEGIDKTSWVWAGRDHEHERRVVALLRLKGITAGVRK